MSTTHLERLQQEIAEITQPLVTHYKEVGEEIGRREKELADLRAARNQLAKTIRSIDPELIEPYFKNGKKNGGGKSKSSDPSAERVAACLVWLQEHKEEVNANGGFHATGLEARYGEKGDKTFPILYQSGISKVLRRLHNQGALRLDHLGTGGAKYFKVP